MAGLLQLPKVMNIRSWTLAEGLSAQVSYLHPIQTGSLAVEETENEGERGGGTGKRDLLPDLHHLALAM